MATFLATMMVTPVEAASVTKVTRDVIVYGGTPSGVAAAVAASRTGAKVTLLAEGSTVGGLMSNGISATDIGSATAVSGLASEFFDRIRRHYKDSRTWRMEPKVAESQLRSMLQSAGVQVRPLSQIRSASLSKGRIRCINLTAPRSYCGKSFIDASYTGDLLRVAGARTRIGMADLLAYAEPLAQARALRLIVPAPAGQEREAAAAYTLNPFVGTSDRLPAWGSYYPEGQPSLTYRLCVSPDPANAVPFRPTSQYASWLPSFKYMAAAVRPMVQRKSNGTLYSDLYQLARLPNGKYDLNAGYLSFTNIPAPSNYFTSSDARKKANRLLADYVQSFYYFAQTDPAVPADVRDVFSPFGLCADEFRDNRNWPREPYVREGRRLVGQYTLTQRDLFTHRTKSSAVALASYNVDGKASRWMAINGALFRDVSVHTTAPVYEVPYAAMVPAGGHPSNILAPVGLSASPTAYGSLRMEPQYMATGQASGIAAALSAQTNRAMSNFPVSRVQKVLRDQGALFKALDACKRTPRSFRRLGGYDLGCTKVLPDKPRIIELV